MKIFFNNVELLRTSGIAIVTLAFVLRERIL